MNKCLICGNHLPHRFRKFCSKSCRNKFHNKKRRAYQNDWQLKFNQKKLLASGLELIQCQICKKYFRQVGSHIVQKHLYDRARDYREDYGFDVKRGQLPKDLIALKGNHVFNNGTVKNLKVGKKYWFKKGGKGIGLYRRSQQTMDRLKENRFLNSIKKGAKK
jgi:hypothetical protein